MRRRPRGDEPPSVVGMDDGILAITVARMDSGEMPRVAWVQAERGRTRSDGDRAKPTARGREHAGSEGSFGAKLARTDNRLPRNALRKLSGRAESEERPLAATAVRRGETASCNGPSARGRRSPSEWRAGADQFTWPLESTSPLTAHR